MRTFYDTRKWDLCSERFFTVEVVHLIDWEDDVRFTWPITERSKIKITPPGINFDTELSIYPIFFLKVQITIKTPKTGGMFQLFYLNVANK